MALVAGIAYADFLTGDEILLYALQLAPVALLAWCAGVYAGLAGAVAAAVATFLAYTAYSAAFRPIHVWQAIVSFTGNAGIAFAVAALRANRERVLALLHAERRLAREDALTGLASARAFYERLALEIDRMRRTGRPLSLLYLDLDDFKRVNDAGGRRAGDELLARTAKTLARAVRRIDLCARLGGDEFGVLMPETAGGEAMGVAGRVRDAFLPTVPGGGPTVAMSAGLGTFREPPTDAHGAIGVVDGLMYEAKRQGKGRIVARTFPA